MISENEFLLVRSYLNIDTPIFSPKSSSQNSGNISPPALSHLDAKAPIFTPNSYDILILENNNSLHLTHFNANNQHNICVPKNTQCVSVCEPVKCDISFMISTDLFIFINYFEFIAYYFIYILSMRIVLALVIGPDCDDRGDMSFLSQNSTSVCSNHDSTPPVLEVGTPNSSINVSIQSLTEGNIDHEAAVFSPTLDNYHETSTEGSGTDINSSTLPNEDLQSLRIKNADRIIIGSLNINSVRNKIGLLEDLVSERIDILLVSETKID